MTARKWGVQLMIEETLTNIKTTLLQLCLEATCPCTLYKLQFYNFLFDIALKGKKSKWMNFIVEH